MQGNNKRSSRFVKAGATGAALLGAAALALGGTTAANADPDRPVVAVGSNTIEAFYDGISNGFNVPGFHSYDPVADLSSTAYIASYDSTGSSTIVTHPGGPAFTRPNGSGDGRKALSAAWDPANHVWSGTTLSGPDVSISRSSALPSTASAWTSGSPTNDETFIPLARDAVGVAENNLSTSIAGFSTNALEAIYGAPAHSGGVYKQHAGVNTVGDVEVVSGSGASQVEGYIASVSPLVVVNVKPVVPQSSSGTRQFFQNALGYIGSAPTLAAWVDVESSAEENTITGVIGAGEIGPFSAAAAIEQNNGLAANTGVNLAGVSFPTIDGSTLFTGTGTSAAPGTLYGSLGTPPAGPAPTAGHYDRDVYTVVPTGNLGVAVASTGVTLQTLADTVEPNVVDDQSHLVVSDYGFDAITYSATTTDWWQNAWEH